MASFQVKIGWKSPRKREYKSYRSNPTRNRKLKKKIAKKFKDLKNTIIASFQAKIGWKRQRKREYKNYCSVSFQHDAKQKVKKKNSKKIQIFKKYHYGFISKPKQVGKCRERENINFIVPFRSFSKRN